MWDKSDHVSERGCERGREEREVGGSLSDASIETVSALILVFTQTHKSTKRSSQSCVLVSL